MVNFMTLRKLRKNSDFIHKRNFLKIIYYKIDFC